MCRFPIIAVTTAFLALSGVANAQASQNNNRQGFNFGTSVSMVDLSSTSLSGNDTFSSTKVKSSGQTVSPYVGYAFGTYFNLGLMMDIENSSIEQHDVSADQTQQVNRSQSTSLTGGSIFMRFLFAKYMYFEGAVGVYEEQVETNNEYLTSSDGGATFNGTHENNSTRGVGPGYHVGAGVELPIVNGFHFTTAYMTRIYQLRDSLGSGNGLDLGSKQSRQEKHGIDFGLSYYLN